MADSRLTLRFELSNNGSSEGRRRRKSFAVLSLDAFVGAGCEPLRERLRCTSISNPASQRRRSSVSVLPVLANRQIFQHCHTMPCRISPRSFPFVSTPTGRETFGAAITRSAMARHQPASRVSSRLAVRSGFIAWTDMAALRCWCSPLLSLTRDTERPEPCSNTERRNECVGISAACGSTSVQISLMSNFRVSSGPRSVCAQSRNHNLRPQLIEELLPCC